MRAPSDKLPGKREDVAALARTEVVPELFRHVHTERGRALIAVWRTIPQLVTVLRGRPYRSARQPPGALPVGWRHEEVSYAVGRGREVHHKLTHRMERTEIDAMRHIALADFLARLGHEPVRRSGNELWYRAPYRNERTPSFRVNVAKHSGTTSVRARAATSSRLPGSFSEATTSWNK